MELTELTNWKNGTELTKQKTILIVTLMVENILLINLDVNLGANSSPAILLSAALLHLQLDS